MWTFSPAWGRALLERIGSVVDALGRAMTRLASIQRGIEALAAAETRRAQVEDDILKTMQELLDEIRRVATVEDSAAAALVAIKAKLDAAVATGDMTQVAAAVEELGQHTDALASAIASSVQEPPAPAEVPPTPAQ